MIQRPQRSKLFPYTMLFRSGSAHEPVLFFFNDTATTEIYTLSLHDALPIFYLLVALHDCDAQPETRRTSRGVLDRKSTRLNSSHLVISYAVFCLKKKKKLAFFRSDDHPSEIHAQSIIVSLRPLETISYHAIS